MVTKTNTSLIELHTPSCYKHKKENKTGVNIYETDTKI